MDRILFNLLSLFLFSAVISCDSSNEIIFEGPYHARFTETESEVLENYKDPFDLNFNEPIAIQIHLAAPSQNNTTVIEYSVSGSAEEGLDYVLDNGENKRVLIPVGEHIGEILYFPINNREQTGDKTIKFTIASVSNGLEPGFGETGVNGRFHTVTIKDDDCLVDLRKFEGIWEFEQNNGQKIYDVEILVDWNANNRIYMLGFTGIDSTIFAFANLDLCQGEFEIPEQLLAGSNQLGFTRTEGKGSFDSEVELLSFAYSMDVAGPETIRTVSARKKNDD
jgi:hypothetical protein